MLFRRLLMLFCFSMFHMFTSGFALVIALESYGQPDWLYSGIFWLLFCPAFVLYQAGLGLDPFHDLISLPINSVCWVIGVGTIWLVPAYLYKKVSRHAGAR